jgi:membrane-associated phospholipid phosphatase
MLVAAGYFAYLGTVALLTKASVRRKAQVFVVCVATVAGIALFGMPHIVPVIYLLIGYWLPALLVSRPKARLEQWLLAFDHRLFDVDGLERFERQAPGLVVEYLELSYLLCYAVVPAGYLWLVLAGFDAHADTFWSIVLLAAFGCYGLLPWMPTRAPRAIEGDRSVWRSSVRGVNLAVLSRGSVQWNTFPSGHTAASVATALAAGAHVPVAGVVLGVIAVSIAIGSVVGRYHYAADAIAGAAVGVLAFLIVDVVSRF